MKYLSLIILCIIISSCYNDTGKFIFYHSAKPICVEDFELYSNELDNITLAIKDDHKRNFIINNEIDSLHYIINNTIYKACKMTFYTKSCDGFNFTVWGRGSIFSMGCTPINEELMHIGQKDDLKFITENNEIIPFTDEKEVNRSDFRFFFGHYKEPMIVGNYEIYKENDKYYLLIKSAGQRFFINEAVIDSIHFTAGNEEYTAPGQYKVKSNDFNFHLLKGKFCDMRMNLYHQELFYIGKENDIVVILDNCEVKDL